MRIALRTGWARAGIAVLGLALASACSDQVVYRTQDRVVTPPAGAGNFVGYATLETKTTTCGSCHAEKQQVWEQSSHAHAWESLLASGHAQPMCEGCHTTGNLGSGLKEATVGWAGTKDARYKDVQCESCHGEGLAHATSPTFANFPLATMFATGDVKNTAGCTACHNGSHHPYAEEWAESPHGKMPFTTGYTGATDGAGTECQGCHTGQWALRKSPTSTASTDVIGFKAGVTRGYKEAGDLVVNQSNFQRITCSVCHDPHAAKKGALRFPAATADTSQNLCIRCHNRRPGGAAPATTWRGPHSGEGQLVMGLNSGWRPPGFMDPLPAQIIGSHADPQSNPKQCVTCHMARYDITDAKGAFVSTTVGHTFNGFPCLNERGQPTGDNSCSIEARTFKSCLGSGCHQTEQAAKSIYVTVEHRLEYLMEELKHLLENDAKVACTEYVYSGKPMTVARGARYNYLLAAGHGHQVPDKCSPLSKGEMIRSLPDPVPAHGAVAHNPMYLERLLTASIQAVKDAYFE